MILRSGLVASLLAICCCGCSDPTPEAPQADQLIEAPVVSVTSTALELPEREWDPAVAERIRDGVSDGEVLEAFLDKIRCIQAAGVEVVDVEIGEAFKSFAYGITAPTSRELDKAEAIDEECTARHFSPVEIAWSQGRAAGGPEPQSVIDQILDAVTPDG